MESFNLFKNLYLTEEGHTSLLKRLLHPNGTHGFNDIFLSLFLKKIGIELEIKKTWKVSTEKKSGERGFIDLYIKSDDNKYVVVIENKVKGAGDQDSQLYRYWRNGIYKVLKKSNKYNPEDLKSESIKNDDDITGRYKLIYLTKEGGQPSESSITKPYASNGKYDNFPEILPYPFKSISYKIEIREWLNECLSEIKQEEHPRLHSSLEQYIEFIEKYMK